MLNMPFLGMVFCNFGIFHSLKLRNGMAFFNFGIFHSLKLRNGTVFFNFRIFRFCCFCYVSD